YSIEKHPGHWQVYGADMAHIQKLMDNDPSTAELLHPDYDYTVAEVIWACKNEMIVKVEDFLARRIRLLLLDAQASLEIAPLVAKIMAEQMNKDQEWINRQLTDYELLVKNYTLPSEFVGTATS